MSNPDEGHDVAARWEWTRAWVKVKNVVWTSYDFITEAGWIVASSAFAIAYPLALAVLDDRFLKAAQPLE
jgi:hypothetical protein